MKNIYKRSITGTIFIIVLVSGIVFHPITCAILFIAIVAFGIWELLSIISPTGIVANKIVGIFAGISLVIITFFYSIGSIPIETFLLMLPISSAIFVMELYRKQPTPFPNIATSFLGVVYVALPFALLLSIGFPTRNMAAYSSTIIIGYFILQWTCDTGAYITGISFGRHPMFARVSPKKSWEGFAGGLFFTILISILLSKYYTHISRIDWIVVAIIISTFGVWGDLIESLLKRSLSIKDSGNILPGHGGILDRFDSVIFSIPMVFLYLQLKNLLFLIP